MSKKRGDPSIGSAFSSWQHFLDDFKTFWKPEQKADLSTGRVERQVAPGQNQNEGFWASNALVNHRPQSSKSPYAGESPRNHVAMHPPNVTIIYPTRLDERLAIRCGTVEMKNNGLLNGTKL